MIQITKGSGGNGCDAGEAAAGGVAPVASRYAAEVAIVALLLPLVEPLGGEQDAPEQQNHCAADVDPARPGPVACLGLKSSNVADKRVPAHSTVYVRSSGEMVRFWKHSQFVPSIIIHL